MSIKLNFNNWLSELKKAFSITPPTTSLESKFKASIETTDMNERLKCVVLRAADNIDWWKQDDATLTALESFRIIAGMGLSYQDCMACIHEITNINQHEVWRHRMLRQRDDLIGSRADITPHPTIEHIFSVTHMLYSENTDMCPSLILLQFWYDSTLAKSILDINVGPVILFAEKQGAKNIAKTLETLQQFMIEKLGKDTSIAYFANQWFALQNTHIQLAACYELNNPKRSDIEILLNGLTRIRMHGLIVSSGYNDDYTHQQVANLVIRNSLLSQPMMNASLGHDPLEGLRIPKDGLPDNYKLKEDISKVITNIQLESDGEKTPTKRGGFLFRFKRKES